jgi:hypothetical protein
MVGNIAAKPVKAVYQTILRRLVRQLLAYLRLPVGKMTVAEVCGKSHTPINDMT